MDFKTETEIDPLLNLYYEATSVLLSEHEAIEKNITEIFDYWLETKIKKKQLVNIGALGEVVGGKSTVAIAIANRINKHLVKLGWLKKFDMRQLVFSDQTEFLRFITTDMEDVAVTIDEFNRLGYTGINATTEEVLFQQYSEQFAQRRIHRISCSPSMLIDRMCRVILTVIGKDERRETTRCKLSYRDPIDRKMVTLGCVDIYVGDVIHEKFYTHYREKKFKRMDLIDKEGVKDIRELEFAQLTLDAFDELKDLVDAGELVPHELALATVDAVRRRHKRIYSMYAVQEVVSRVKALTGLYRTIMKIKIAIKSKKVMGDKFLLQMKLKALGKVEDMYKKRIDDEKNLVRIHEEYVRIK